MLAGRKVLLGVSGSIAAYKAVEVLRRLVEQKAEVRVVMTRSAAKLVAPLTFAALSGLPVLTDEFENGGWGPMGHIDVTAGLDVLLVAPATANIIAKAAAGIADDALSTALLAADCPAIMAPAMNDRMYRNAFVQRNIGTLRDAGVRIVEPGTGSLACGVTGTGRLAEVDAIVAEVTGVLAPGRVLAGMRVLVTAGPTREPVDAVRYLSNPSSGKMGYALARAARDRGAEVVLVTGPTALEAPRGVMTVPVSTAEEMRRAVQEHVGGCQAVIMAAAVSDFRPVAPAKDKIKKEQAALSIALERTVDILAELRSAKGGRILVGFAAETGNAVEEAQEKLKRKGLDLIIANDLTLPGAGFSADTNIASIIDRRGTIERLPRMTKDDLAGKIVQKVAELKANQGL